MTTTQPIPVHKALNYARTAELRAFRKHVESQGRLSLAEISLEASCLLYDLCQHWKLDSAQTRAVLGEQTAAAVENYLGSAGT